MTPSSLTMLSSCLADLPRRKDLAIEALHRIRDTFGQLTSGHVSWLVQEFGLSKAEVFELISFYDCFALDVPVSKLRICTGPACRMAGSSDLLKAYSDMSSGAIGTGCIGACDTAPAALEGSIRRPRFEVKDTRRAVDVHSNFSASPHVSPFGSPGEILSIIKASGLCGMGGAGFSVAQKWRAVMDQPGQRYVVVNADEGEPGAFKDRFLFEHAASQVLTGALFAAKVVDARHIYVYIRDEYADLLKPLKAMAGGVLKAWPGMEIEWRRGAGSYVCGEETALLESIEGRPARPRHKPPYPAQAGLFGCPTLINNVETLFWVNEILAQGYDWYAQQGRHGGRGLRLFSVSGRVARPGVYVAPVGISFEDLIEQHCGGMAQGHALSAFLPGGAAGGVLPAALADTPLEAVSLEKHGASLGSASVIVLSQDDDVRDVVSQLMTFLAKESCGQCAPCRLGTQASAQALSDTGSDDRMLLDFAEAMQLGSICGLGHGAGRLLGSYIRHFAGGHAQ